MEHGQRRRRSIAEMNGGTYFGSSSGGGDGRGESDAASGNINVKDVDDEQADCRTRIAEAVFGSLFVLLVKSQSLRLPLPLAIAMAILLSCQLVSFAIYPLLGWSNSVSGVVFDITGVTSFLSFGMSASPSVFWISLGLIIIAISLILVTIFYATHTTSVLFFRTTRITISFIGSFMYIPLLVSFISAIQCKIGFPDDGNTTMCWSIASDHIRLNRIMTVTALDRAIATLGLVGLIATVAIGTLSHGFLFEDNPISKHAVNYAQPHSRTAIKAMLVKTFLVILIRVLSPLMHQRVTSAFVASTLCYHFLIHMRDLPWYSFTMCEVHLSLFAFVAWAGICSFVSSLIDNPADYGTAIIFYMLSPLVIACGVLLAKARRHQIEHAPEDKFESIYDIDLKSRFFLESVTSRATDEHASEVEVALPENQPFFRKVNSWYSNSANYHPQSVLALLLYAQFVLYYLRDTKALVSIMRRARELHPNIDDQFRLFKLEQLTRHVYEEHQYEEQRAKALSLLEKGSNRANGRGGDKEHNSMSSALLKAAQKKRVRDLAINLALEKHTADALHIEELSTRAQIKFWLELQKNNPELEVLSTVASEITKYSERANYHAYKILKMRSVLSKSVAVEEQLKSTLEFGAQTLSEDPQMNYSDFDGARSTSEWFGESEPMTYTRDSVNFDDKNGTNEGTSSLVRRGSLAFGSAFGNSALLAYARLTTGGASRDEYGKQLVPYKDLPRVRYVQRANGPVGTLLIRIRDLLNLDSRGTTLRLRNLQPHSGSKLSSNNGNSLVVENDSGRSRNNPLELGSASAASLLAILSEYFQLDNGDVLSLAMEATKAYVLPNRWQKKSEIQQTSPRIVLPDFVSLFKIEEANDDFLNLFGYEKWQLTSYSGFTLDNNNDGKTKSMLHPSVMLPDLFPEPFRTDQIELLKKFTIASIAALSELNNDSQILVSKKKASNQIDSTNSSGNAVGQSGTVNQTSIPFTERLLQVYSHLYLLGQHYDGSIFPLMFSARPVWHPMSPAAFVYSFESLHVTNRQHYILTNENNEIVSCTANTLSLFEPHLALKISELSAEDIRNSVAFAVSGRSIESWLPGFSKLRRGCYSNTGTPFIIPLWKPPRDNDDGNKDESRKVLLVRLWCAPSVNRLNGSLVPKVTQDIPSASASSATLNENAMTSSRQAYSRLAARRSSLPSLPAVMSNTPKGAGGLYMPAELSAHQNAPQRDSSFIAALAPPGSMAALSPALAPSLVLTQLRTANLYAAPCELPTPQDPDSLYKLHSRIIRAKSLAKSGKTDSLNPQNVTTSNTSNKKLGTARLPGTELEPTNEEGDTTVGGDSDNEDEEVEVKDEEFVLGVDDFTPLLKMNSDMKQQSGSCIFFEIVRVLSFNPNKIASRGRDAMEQGFSSTSSKHFIKRTEEADETEDEDAESVLHGMTSIKIVRSPAEENEEENGLSTLIVNPPPFPGSFEQIDDEPVQIVYNNQNAISPRESINHDPPVVKIHSDSKEDSDRSSISIADDQISGYSLFQPAATQEALNVLEVSQGNVKKSVEIKNIRPKSAKDVQPRALSPRVFVFPPSPVNQTKKLNDSEVDPLLKYDLAEHRSRLLAVFKVEEVFNESSTEDILNFMKGGGDFSFHKMKFGQQQNSEISKIFMDLLSNGFKYENLDTVLDQELPHFCPLRKEGDEESSLATYSIARNLNNYKNQVTRNKRYLAFKELDASLSSETDYPLTSPRSQNTQRLAKKSVSWTSTIGSTRASVNHIEDSEGGKHQHPFHTEINERHSDGESEDEDEIAHENEWILGNDERFSTSNESRFNRLLRWRRAQDEQQKKRRGRALKAKQKVLDRLQRTAKAMGREGHNAGSSNAISVLKSLEDDTADLQNQLRSHIAAENRASQRTTRKFQIAFIFTIFVVALFGLAQFISQYVQVTNFYSNLKVLRSVSMRSEAVARSGYATQYLSSMRAGWTPDPNYQGIPQPTFIDVQKNLFSLASLLAEGQSSVNSADRKGSLNAFEAGSIQIYSPASGSSSPTPFSTAVSNFVMRLKDVSSLPQALVTPSHSSVGHILANAASNFFEALLESTRRLSNDIQKIVDESNKWALALLITSLVGMVLSVLFIIRPTILDIQENKSKILKIFTGIPDAPVRRIYALASLRLAVIIGDLAAIKDAQSEALIATKRDLSEQLPRIAQSETGTAVSTLQITPNQDERPEKFASLSFSFVFRIALVFIASMAFYFALYFGIYYPVKESMEASARTAYYHSLQSATTAQVFFELSTLTSNDPSTLAPNLVALSKVTAHLDDLERITHALVVDAQPFNGQSLYDSTLKRNISPNLRELWFGKSCEQTFPSESLIPSIPNTVFDEYGIPTVVGPFHFQDYFVVPNSQCVAFEAGTLSAGLQMGIHDFILQTRQLISSYNPSPPAMWNAQWTLQDNYWRILQAMQLKSIELYVSQIGDKVNDFEQASIIAVAVYCGVVALLYYFIYHPLIVQTHAQLKSTRAMLFLIPPEILTNVPVFRQWLRAKKEEAARSAS